MRWVRNGTGKGREEKRKGMRLEDEGEKGGSEAQGLVLFGALLVCHHGDQGLHGAAQIVGHVEQTADGGT